MKAYVHFKTRTRMFIAALFLIAKNGNKKHTNVHQKVNGQTVYIEHKLSWSAYYLKACA